jgi:hypothetical protein
VNRLAAVAAALVLALAPAADAKPKKKSDPGTPSSPYAACDDLDASVCLQPFPNNLFTKPASGTDTGLQVAFAITSMPRNFLNKPIQPDEWNRNDGFSPGSLLTTHVPDLDLSKTHGVPIDDLSASYDGKAAIVVLDTGTDARQYKRPRRNLIWTEMDANATSEATRNLIIRPAKNFREGHHYVVALRNLKDSKGETIPAGDAFAGYRDGKTDDSRTDHMKWIFGKLAKAGIGADKNLFLAWDFTIASERNLSERMLHIRDDAFAQLGDKNLANLKIEGDAPSFHISKVEDFAAGSGPIARRVTGTFEVPCYISTPGCQAGGGFLYEPGTNHPMQLPGNTYTSKFVCNVPFAAMDKPARASLYGHGLFGSTGETNQGQLKNFAQEHDFVFCGTDWAGMACENIPDPSQQYVEDLLSEPATYAPNCDVPNVVTAIGDLSRFNTMIDRVQEGMLAFLYLGRLMSHPNGLTSDAAFKNASGTPVIDTSLGRTYYDGNSQGGIIGGALAAFLVDSDRASIGVPGMNYSTLLQRSTDFGRGTDDECTRVLAGDLPSYACLVYKAYPSEADRQLVMALMQMLWDRGEANGYAWHMTGDPYPNTPKHKVLMSLAFGDHQVTNWAAAVEARTIGARLRTPVLNTDDRGPGADYRDFGEIPAIPGYPWSGSAITVWDSGPIRDNCSKGTAAPLLVNLPVFADCPAGAPQAEWGGHDPHEEPRNTVENRNMKSAFLAPDGVVIDTCGGQPCYSRNWRGAQ